MTTLHPLAIGIFFSNDDFMEVFLYGGAFFFIVIMLFILVPFLRSRINSNIRNQQMTFGMDVQDVEKLRQKGILDEEEMKKVRQAMARNLVERTKQEDEKKKIPASAAAALALAEQEAITAKQQGNAPPTPKPAPQESAPPVAEKPKPLDLPMPSSEVQLPEKLAPLSTQSDFELEQLVEAGFLNEEEAALIRKARPREGSS